MLLSPDGRCRPFDAAANGTAAGEGCGVLVLKRLEDAIADNDTVLAVIKGTAINSDGQRKVGFAAPSSEGQARVIRSALDRAEVGPETIGYIEAHGTATKLGDPIEIAALMTVFASVPPGSCAIGSVKSNIGHLGEASGVAGAIKAVLALQHRCLPASLHYETPNPLIGLETGPFFVNAQQRTWRGKRGVPLRAGVSSFGIGGTNAHAILEESTFTPVSGPSRREHLVLLSAGSEEALRTIERNLIAHAQTASRIHIADLCYTLHVGRKELPYRKAFVVAGMEELAARVEATDAFCAIGHVSGTVPRLIFLFPAESEYSAGLGSELYRREPVFRDCADRCFEIAQRCGAVGVDAESLIAGSSDASASNDERNHALSFIVEYALAQLLRHWGYSPHACLGAGVGEYVAACLAGALSIEDAMPIIVERGRLRPGDAQSGAGLLRFEQALRRARWSAPGTPFLSGASGDWIREEQLASPEYWIEQLRSPMPPEAAIRTLCRDGSHLLVEVGPGRSLCDLAMRHSPTQRREHCIDLMPDPQRVDSGSAVGTLFEGLCRLFVAGIAPDWKRFHEGRARRRIPLPTYPFAGTCHYPQALLRPSVPALSAAEGPADRVGESGAADPGAMSAAVSVQDRLQAIWCKYLGIDRIAVDQDVFDLGVDSLLSIRVITEIRETFSADIALDTIFGLRTVAAQAAEIERKLGAGEALTIPPIRAYDHRGLGPLSTSQRRLWVISHLDRDQGAYNAGSCMVVKHANGPVLERAFRRLIERHAILRTNYLDIDGVAMQRINDTFEFNLEYADISHVAPHLRDSEGDRLWQQALMDPIDLRRDLMIRAKLVRYGDDRHLLIVTQHHICADNWSNNVLMTEIGALYDAYMAGRDDPLPPLPVQYIDYAIWQNAWLQSDLLGKQLAYWRSALEGIPQVHNLPLDRPRPKYQSYRGQLYTSRVDASVLESLNRLSVQNGATLFMTMQAAFSVLLARYSGDDDIVLGFSVANRLHRELEGLIGFFVNPLVLRSDLSGNPPFTRFLAATRQKLLDAYANAHVPFETLVDELRPARSMSHEPIIQIKLIYLDQSQDLGGRGATREDQEGVVHADMQVPYSKYDLTVYFSVADGSIVLNWEFATDLFERETIRRMAESFEALLRGIVDAPERTIRSLPLTLRTEPPQSPRQDHPMRLEAGTASVAVEPVAARSMGGEAAAVEQDAAEAKPDQTGQNSGSGPGFSLFYFASDDGGRSADKYRLLIEGARFADRNGFEAVWTPERHFDAFGGVYPNPAITAAALATITERVKLRAGSCVLPLHNPVRVAEDWAVIDNLSGGRVGIGFAAGYSPTDFALAPDKFEHRREVLNRDVQTVKALWRGESVAMRDGNGAIAEIAIRPRPIQPELPVWVTTVGSEDAFRHAARMGHHVLTHLMGQTLDELTRKIAIYREERRTSGHDDRGIITLLVHTFIADDEQVIFDKVKEPFKRYLIDSVGTPQAIAKSLGAGGTGADGQGDERQRDIDAITEFAFRRYYQSNALLGTPERCLPLLQAIRRAGVDEIACLIDFGVEPELVLQSLSRLVRLRNMLSPGSVACEDLPASSALPPGVAASIPVPDAPAVPDTTPRAAQDAAQAMAQDPMQEPVACIHRLFERCVQRHPDAVAVVDEEQRLTYRELNRRANRIAHRLIDGYGVGPETRVALCVGRSVQMIVGLLAILKAGAAYVPIEPDNPAARVEGLIRDAGIDLVLTRTGDDRCLQGLAVSRLAIGGAEDHPHAPEHDPTIAVSPRNSAYVIFTSGSTGTPKGVVIEHRSAVNFWRVMSTSTHGACPPHARIALNASFAFDMSLKGILQLLSGHALHIVPQAIRADGAAMLGFLRRHAIHAFDSTPSQLDALLAAGLLDDPDYHPVSVLLGGEPINAMVWSRLRQAKHIRFYNMYGPTECTVDATIGLIAEDDAAPHIGRPIANAQVHLLDDYGQPVPHGAVGEICIGGMGVARGYLNRPQLTAERFVADPHAAAEGGRLYRTGDLGRWLDDGNLGYVGRNDQQVKLRGFRIELTEIESHLIAHAVVRTAAVLIQGEDDARCMVAYVVPNDDRHDQVALQFELKRAMMDALPAYMVPQAFVFMPSLPLDPNGKLDRRALSMQPFALPREDDRAPETGTERALAAIWCELLGRPEIGARANFFELGGHSLLVVRTTNEIAKRLGITLEMRAIFEYGTIESLANYIDNALWARRGDNGTHEPLREGEVVLEI
jgi:natural product biosynthesis luciferase-like monooxygenase protein/amino acid adenylation domain-containing protein